jgi:thiol-disulfide isomerase/thioredoxin
VPTLVVVFASWCGACRAELATVDAVRARHPTLRVVGLNAYEEWGALSDEARLRAFVGEHAAWLRVVPAGDDLLPALGGVPKIPSLFVYDRAGRLAAAFRRDRRAPPDAAELDAALAAAAR